MDEKNKRSYSDFDIQLNPSEDTMVLEPYQLRESPLSAEIPMSHVSEIVHDDPYEGREVSLYLEGGQEVFYRGNYVTKIVLQDAPLLIGRRDVMAGHYPDVDLAMYWKQDRSVSRRHLRIYRDMNGSYFVEDLCNNHATFLNSYDRPLNRERVELKNGDRILVSMSVAFCFTVH
ncbi:MAG: FHA domain-containing protein [Proteobacteria bacterium]|nr:FHA domain-containing protein [Pseudomonadota bacterium]